MVVKKKTRKLCVCVDFTDLNKVCPKDPFPMPQIDQLVDAIVDKFLECFSRVSSDTTRTRRSGKNSFCYSYWKLSLKSDTFWFEKRRVYLSMDDD